MRFLERHDDGPAGAWWEAVANYPGGAPGIVGERLRASPVPDSGLRATPIGTDANGIGCLRDMPVQDQRRVKAART